MQRFGNYSKIAVKIYSFDKSREISTLIQLTSLWALFMLCLGLSSLTENSIISCTTLPSLADSIRCSISSSKPMLSEKANHFRLKPLDKSRYLPDVL
jgi:hypothetical protein